MRLCDAASFVVLVLEECSNARKEDLGAQAGQRWIEHIPTGKATVFIPQLFKVSQAFTSWSKALRHLCTLWGSKV